MNILYLSHLSGQSYAGPTYSVPQQIEFQSKIDNVFWFNAVRKSPQIWRNLDYYYDLNDFSQESIYNLPTPFNNPDLIVVESFYNITKSNFIKELTYGKFRYIIIPRGELTKQAQKRRRIKKAIANIIICKKFANRALAIQYLTKQEYLDSGDKWNKNYFIVSNGINMPSLNEKKGHHEGIRCLSIGRIEPYQKGIDLLIEVCKEIKQDLVKKKCTIDIYGPDVDGKLKNLNDQIMKYDLEDIIRFHDGLYGEDKINVIKASDVFIMLSRFEGHPMALIEALSYGLPCVITKGTNMKLEIEKYDAGWTADNSVNSSKKAMKNMLESIECYQQKSKNAINLASNYEWSLLAEKSHKLFENALLNARKRKY